MYAHYTDLRKQWIEIADGEPLFYCLYSDDIHKMLLIKKHQKRITLLPFLKTSSLCKLYAKEFYGGAKTSKSPKKCRKFISAQNLDSYHLIFIDSFFNTNGLVHAFIMRNEAIFKKFLCLEKIQGFSKFQSSVR